MLCQARLHAFPGGFEAMFALKPGSETQPRMDRARVGGDRPLEAITGLVESPEPLKLLADQHEQGNISRRKFRRLAEGAVGKVKIQRSHLGNAQLEPELCYARKPLHQVTVACECGTGPAADQMLLGLLPPGKLPRHALKLLEVCSWSGLNHLLVLDGVEPLSRQEPAQEPLTF